MLVIRSMHLIKKKKKFFLFWLYRNVLNWAFVIHKSEQMEEGKLLTKFSHLIDRAHHSED